MRVKHLIKLDAFKSPRIWLIKIPNKRLILGYLFEHLLQSNIHSFYDSGIPKKALK
jgi:hypothetical protein